MSLEGFELMVLAFNGELRQQIRNPARAHRTGGFRHEHSGRPAPPTVIGRRVLTERFVIDC